MLKLSDHIKGKKERKETPSCLRSADIGNKLQTLEYKWVAIIDQSRPGKLKQTRDRSQEGELIQDQAMAGQGGRTETQVTRPGEALLML